ncbi:galactokinase [Micromonospora sp. CPCC 206060]|uniref:galactokinase n=1 Tax=Micromonospora sp. CPCC 206060 TaxID=3122406 RepID=UPI002FF200D8
MSAGNGTSAEQGVWVAPGRVNLIGEHTDYNDGFVLPFALPHRTVVTAGLLPGATRWAVSSSFASEPTVLTPDDLVPGRATGWAGYVAGVLWALTDAGYALPGAELSVDSDVPVGAGLSSSAALECAVLTAMCDLAGIDLPVADRPRLAQRAENVYVGVPCGVMDQAASTLCRAGHALFLDCRSLAVEHVPFDLAAAGLAMLVIDSRTPHQHVDNEYALRRRTCEQAARQLGVPALRDVDDLDAALRALPDAVTRRRVRHVVTENQRVRRAVDLLRAGRLPDIGPLLTASHRSMRDDYEITVAQVDLAVDVALDAGALGARMTGGGFGGCVLALVDADRADAVRAAIAGAYADRGFDPPVSFLAEAGAGAYRVR